MKNLFATSSHLSPDQIKAYIEGSLEEEKRFEIENHLLDCELCDAAVEGFSESYDFEEDQHLKDLATRFPDSKAAAEAQIRPLRYNYRWLNRIAVAAAVLVLPLAAWWYWQAQSPERLYSTYFNSYTSDYLAVRGTEDVADPLLKKAIEQYQQKAYQNSLSLLDTYLQTHPENTIAAFHAGLASLEIGQSRKAIQYLEPVRFNDEQYYEDASWYLALAHLQLGEQKEAQSILDDLLKIKDGYYEQKAMALRKSLK